MPLRELDEATRNTGVWLLLAGLYGVFIAWIRDAVEGESESWPKRLGRAILNAAWSVAVGAAALRVLPPITVYELLLLCGAFAYLGTEASVSVLKWFVRRWRAP